MMTVGSPGPILRIPQEVVVLISAEVPPTLAGSVIRASAYCRSCGYNLRGLTAGGRCPECGSEVWQTILHLVDPAGSRLPKLVNPGRVGNSLLWLMCCLLLSRLLLAVFALDRWLEDTGLTRHSALLDFLPVRDLPWISAAMAGAGLVGVWGLARPKGPDPTGAVRRDIRLIFLGLVIWTGVLAVRSILFRTAVVGSLGDPVWPALSLAVDVGAIVVFVGLRGGLLTIGLRSREYRNAQGARQGLLAMVAAVCAHAAGRLLQFLESSIPGGLPIARGFSQILVSVSSLMLIIGLGYLVLNAWWIRASLRKPPPSLEEVLLIQNPTERQAPRPGQEADRR